jgi:hypothetical protein
MNIRPSDFYVLFDSGCHGIMGMLLGLLGLLKDNCNKAHLQGSQVCMNALTCVIV